MTNSIRKRGGLLSPAILSTFVSECLHMRLVHAIFYCGKRKGFAWSDNWREDWVTAASDAESESQRCSRRRQFVHLQGPDSVKRSRLTAPGSAALIITESSVDQLHGCGCCCCCCTWPRSWWWTNALTVAETTIIETNHFVLSALYAIISPKPSHPCTDDLLIINILLENTSSGQSSSNAMRDGLLMAVSLACRIYSRLSKHNKDCRMSGKQKHTTV